MVKPKKHKRDFDDKSFYDAESESLLSACLLQPDKWWYLSDLAGHLSLTPSSLQRELASLTEAQLLESRKDGNRVYYKANVSSPGISELQSLLIKTIGVADLLKSTLKAHLGAVDFAFIYGSLARGEAVATSDVDLMLIGDIKLSIIAGALKKAEKSLGREVNATIYSSREFVRKINEGDSFLKTVMGDKKILLKGKESELEDLVG